MYAGAYIKRLQADTAAKLKKDELARAEQKRAAAKTARERLTPLKSRVARLLEDIPQELQQEGLSLPVLQAALRGRQGGNVHAGELGAVLRRLGFQRERRWRGDDGFRAVWRRAPTEPGDNVGLAAQSHQDRP